MSRYSLAALLNFTELTKDEFCSIRPYCKSTWHSDILNIILPYASLQHLSCKMTLLNYRKAEVHYGAAYNLLLI